MSTKHILFSMDIRLYIQQRWVPNLIKQHAIRAIIIIMDIQSYVKTLFRSAISSVFSDLCPGVVLVLRRNCNAYLCDNLHGASNLFKGDNNVIWAILL